MKSRLSFSSFVISLWLVSLGSVSKAENSSSVPLNSTFNFEQFTPELFSWNGRYDAFQLVAEHPGGLPFHRLKRVIAPGQREAMVRNDVEGIDVAERLTALSEFFMSHSTNATLWDHVFLFWSSFLPDSDNGQVMRIRNLAIDLQNMDVNGTWDYATLRQKVHNFPSANIVQELADEIAKVEQANPEDSRLAPLKELHRLERDFWFGQELQDSFVKGWLKAFGLSDLEKAFAFHRADTPMDRVEKLLKIRDEVRLAVGHGHRNIYELMNSPSPLNAEEVRSLMSVLVFDRKLSTEVGRTLSKIAAISEPERVISALIEALYLDGFIPIRERRRLHALNKDLKQNLESIQKGLERPILELQGQFSALRLHYSQIREVIPPTLNRDRQPITPSAQEVLGEPSRLMGLADTEIRQSILFNVGTLMATVAKNFLPRLNIHVTEANQSRTFVASDLEAIRPIVKTIQGRVMFVHNAESLKAVSDRVAQGQSIILVKTIGYDIELPPVAMLITFDRAINRASHMALLAESSGIPHLNSLDPNSEFASCLRKFSGQDMVFDPNGSLGIEIFTAPKLGSGRASDAKKVQLVNRIQDDFAEPVSLENLINVELGLKGERNQISGGKGRGLALLLSLAEEEEREILKIPRAIQIPYGFFLKWFREIQVDNDWALTISPDTNNESVRWRRLLEELAELSIPAPLLEQITLAMAPDHVDQGWFVRSNTIAEDGTFNAAGVNLTIPNVRHEGELAKSILKVFLAPYEPNARAWWRRMFSNPSDIRSTVLLMKTIVSTHSSVALLASDGTRFTIDSLPGIGENVVGGHGAIAERLLIDSKEPNAQLLQEASTQMLRVWENGQVVPRALIIKGRVLNDIQRSNVSKMMSVVRKIADKTPEFSGHPLDLELAWEGDAPRLVQIRLAPKEPEKAKRASVSKDIATERSLISPRISELSGDKIATSFLYELNGSPLISPSLQVKLDLIFSVGIKDKEILEKLLRAFQKGTVDVLQRINAGDLHYEQGRVYLNALIINESRLRNRDARIRGIPWAIVGPRRRQILDLLGRIIHGAPKNVTIALLDLLIGSSSNEVGTSLYFDLMREKTADELINEYLPLTTEWRDYSFNSAMIRIFQRYLRDIFLVNEKRAQEAFHALVKIEQSKPIGRVEFHQTVYKLVASNVIGALPTPQLDSEYSHEISDYLRSLNGLNLGLNADRDSDLEKVIDCVRYLLEDFKRLRYLGLFREEFLADTLHIEEKSNPAARNLERLVGVLLELNSNSHQYPQAFITRTFKMLNGLPGISTLVVMNPNWDVEVEICVAGQKCTFLPMSQIPLPIVMQLPNLRFEFSTSLRHVPSNDYTLRPPGMINNTALWLRDKEMAYSDVNLFLLSWYALRIYSDRNSKHEDAAFAANQLHRVTRLAKQKKSRMSLPDWQRLVLVYLNFASVDAQFAENKKETGSVWNEMGEIFLGDIGDILSARVPFDLKNWRTENESLKIGTAKEWQRLTTQFFAPDSASPMFSVSLVKSSEGVSRGLKVNILGFKYGPVSHYDPIAAIDNANSNAAQRFYQVVNFLTGGKLRQLAGERPMAPNRSRRIQACEGRLVDRKNELN